MDTVGKRIAEARKSAGWSQAKLAAAVNVGQTTISSWEKDRTEPDREDVRRVAIALGVQVAQLEPTLIEVVDSIVARPVEDRLDVVHIPEFDIRLSAGAGSPAYDVPADNWAFPPQYIEGVLRLRPKDLFLASVIGDSMAPNLLSGDYVIIDKSDMNVKSGAIFAVMWGDTLVIKRVQPHPERSDPPKIVLVSDNKSISDVVLTYDEAQVVGRVVWFGRRM